MPFSAIEIPPVSSETAVAQAERFRNVGVVRDGQNAACCADALVRYDHSSIVEWTVLEEDVFDEALRDVGIDLIARIDIFAQSHVALNDNECSHFLLAHIDTSHHDGHDVFAVNVALFLLNALEEML